MDDVQTLYVSRAEDAERQALPDLSLVATTIPLVGMEGAEIPVGAEGTIVGVWQDGVAYEVEFPEPYDDVATVRSADLRRIG